MSPRGGLQVWVKNPKQLSVVELRALRDAADNWMSFASNYHYTATKSCCIETLLTAINQQLDQLYDSLAESWGDCQMYM